MNEYSGNFDDDFSELFEHYNEDKRYLTHNSVVANYMNDCLVLHRQVFYDTQHLYSAQDKYPD